MQATINFNHIKDVQEDVKRIMDEVCERLAAMIEEERDIPPVKPTTRKTLILRRTVDVIYPSFNEFHGDKADKLIEEAKTVEHKWYRLYSNGVTSPTDPEFKRLSDLCYSYYHADLHRWKMANRFAEALLQKAVSVTLSDKELSNCNYYRRMLLD